MGIEITGFAYDSSGAALTSKAVKLYDKNTTANARASGTTNSDGKFTFSNSDVTVSSVYQMDVEITDGSNKTRYKYDDEIMLQRVDVKDFVLRSGSSNQYVATLIPETLTADATVTIPNETGTVLITDASGNVGDQTQTQIQELFINETSNASQTYGITIDTASSATANISLKASGSVAHGLTTYAETDTYAFLQLADNNGGLAIYGVNDTAQSDSLDAAVRIRGYQRGTANSGSNASAAGAVCIEGVEHDGSNSIEDIGAAENILVIKSGAGTDDTTHIFEGNGDLIIDGSSSAFDDYDDVALLTAWNGAVANEDRYKVEFKDWVDEHKSTLEDLDIIHPNKDGSFHYSIKNLNSLMVGAIRQLGDKVNKLEEQLALKGAE